MNAIDTTSATADREVAGSRRPGPRSLEGRGGRATDDDLLVLAQGLLPEGVGRRQVRLLTDARPLGLRPGDLIFGNRLSPVHRVLATAGDPWTHSAVVAVVDGALGTVELGPVGVFSRSIEEFLLAYRYVGVARLAMSERCVDAIARSAQHELASQRLAYSWGACSVAGAAALVRRAGGRRGEAAVIAAVRHAAAAHLRRSEPSGLTCSGFVVRVLQSACPACRPELVWPRRDRVAAWRGATSATDLCGGRSVPTDALVRDPAAVEVLWTPSDVWAADRAQVRSVVRPDSSTLVIELADRPTPQRCVARPTREEVSA